MDAFHFATLRDKLRNAKQFSDVWEYFLDHVAHDPQFEAEGYRTQVPALEAMLEQYCLDAFGRKPGPTSTVLVRYAPANLVHGGANLGRQIVNVLFFEDIGVGVLYELDTTGRPGRVGRFTLKPDPSRPDPKQN